MLQAPPLLPPSGMQGFAKNSAFDRTNAGTMMQAGIGAGIGGIQSTMPSAFSIPAFHGSNADFSKFDIEKARAGFAGTGIYTSPERDLAKMYGKNLYSTSLPYSEKQIMKFELPISEQNKNIQKSISSIIKKHGLSDINKSSATGIDLYRSLVDKISSGLDDLGGAERTIATEMASKELNSSGIKGSNFKMANIDAYALYSDKGLKVDKKAASFPTTKEINIPQAPTKVDAVKQTAKNIARYYTANPKEAATALGKGGALAAVGAGVDYGLQKAVPKTTSGSYLGDVYNNLRDFGIAGASGGVGGPLGASIGIGSELAKKTYGVAQEASSLLKYKAQSNQLMRGINRNGRL
jgi:hypothetical protein